MPRAAVARRTKPRSSAVGVLAAREANALAAGCFADTVAALRLDLEQHRQKAAEIETLIGKLTTYTNGTAEVRRRVGRPPADPSDEGRRRKANNMRAWRARQASKQPKARARKRRRKAEPKPKAQESGEVKGHGAEMASCEVIERETLGIIQKVFDEAFEKMFDAGTPPAAVAAVDVAVSAPAPKPRKKRKPQRVPGCPPSSDMYRQPLSTISETVGIDGTVTRTRTTEGVRPILQGERPQL